MAVYRCKNCSKCWNYPVKKCIFCDGDVDEAQETSYTVIGSTQVYVPSAGNEKVPYFDYLLEDKNGDKRIIKSFDGYALGDAVDVAIGNRNRSLVGVIGTGQLGSGIAECLLRNGYATLIKSRSGEGCDKAIAGIRRRLSRDHTGDQVIERLQGLGATTRYQDLKDCDLIIEAAPEDMGIKKDVFMALSGICAKKTIFATNTSSLSIDELAAVTDRPDHCVGMHFFNPVSKMDLIEVVIGRDTSEYTRNFIINFSKGLNKKPIPVNNNPGFIVNRLLMPQINDAVRLFEKGVASKEDIDSAMKLGLNHPMGPFALADLIGIDICVSILNTLYDSFKEERYKPADTLVGLMNGGRLGRKSGEGFYGYR